MPVTEADRLAYFREYNATRRRPVPYAPCSIGDCDRPRKYRALCHAHYMRQRQGDLRVERAIGDRSRPSTPWQERFWAKVDTSAGAQSCWPWTGGRDGKDYGLFTVVQERGATVRVSHAHRLALELTRGPLGDLHALHRCDNPPCCNPAHLFAGTNDDNVADKVAKGRTRKGLPRTARLPKCRPS